MKKNSFVEGAFISTLGIILCKLLGLFYVIPFRAIIGPEGAILYGYAYTIYSVFAGLSSSGIPSAMAKTISEYNTLGYYNSQERAYKICRMIVSIIGIISFIILFIFAKQIAYLIIGNIQGGNSIEDIAFVIRVISTALIFIPLLSVSKGYVQGHRMMKVPAFANVIEQLVRVVVIIFGSFLTLKVFNLSVTTAVGIATFGATAGAIVAYLYVIDKMRKNREILKRNEPATREEAKITNKYLFKKIVIYSLPFVLIELVRSVYSTVDTFTVVKSLTNLGIAVKDSESILSLITTWGSKINMIVLSITMGLAISIVPNVVSSAVAKNFKDVSHKINQALKIIVFTALPLTLGISFLSTSVWTIFYGYDSLSINVFAFYIFQALFLSFYYILIDTTQALSDTKAALGTLFGALFLKLILNVPCMYLFKKIGIEPYYAPVFVTMFVQFIGAIYLLNNLRKKYKINYKESIIPCIKIVVINLIMLLSLMILKLLIEPFPTTRIFSLIEIILYGMIGLIIYMFFVIKQNLLEEVFGIEFANKIYKLLRLKK